MAFTYASTWANPFSLSLDEDNNNDDDDNNTTNTSPTPINHRTYSNASTAATTTTAAAVATPATTSGQASAAVPPAAGSSSTSVYATGARACARRSPARPLNYSSSSLNYNSSISNLVTNKYIIVGEQANATAATPNTIVAGFNSYYSNSSSLLSSQPTIASPS